MRYFLIYLSFVLFSIISAFADEAASDAPSFENKLTGDWGGFRNQLFDAGIELNMLYTAEPWYIPQNDFTDEFYYVDYFQLFASFNLNDIFGLHGGKVLFHYIGNNGGFPGEDAGVAQGISSIEAHNTYKILDFFYYQDFLDDRICFLAGLIDLNAHFDVKNTAGLFLNPSHGIGVEFAQSGENGPSIFPTSSLGAVLRLEPLKNIHIQTGVFDGVSGDPENPNGTQVILKNSDGLLVSSTLYYITGTSVCELLGPCEPPDRQIKLIDNYSKIGIGFWYYTDDYKYIASHIKNWGVYMVFEEDVYLEEDDPHQGLSINGRIGTADEIVYQFNYYIGAGIVYTGLLPGRSQDQTGIAVAAGHNSYNYRLNKQQRGLYAVNFETDIEFTYKFFVNSYFSVQLDMQYINQPSLLDVKKDMFFTGCRIEIDF